MTASSARVRAVGEEPTARPPPDRTTPTNRSAATRACRRRCRWTVRGGVGRSKCRASKMHRWRLGGLAEASRLLFGGSTEQPSSRRRSRAHTYVRKASLRRSTPLLPLECVLSWIQLGGRFEVASIDRSMQNQTKCVVFDWGLFTICLFVWGIGRGLRMNYVTRALGLAVSCVDVCPVALDGRQKNNWPLLFIFSLRYCVCGDVGICMQKRT